MSDLFFNEKIELNEKQENELIEILTKRCGQKVKNRFYGLIKFDLQTIIKSVYLMERFYISEEGEIHYCAGQSYPCEIKAIRQEILKKIPIIKNQL